MTEDVFMRQALTCARRGLGRTRPNPPVGAVVVRNGRIIGQGWHRRCGGNHAETAALKACSESPAGATVYVTLEPCSRPGRVGACCDALIEAGVKKVVWACPDPNPVNRGRAARVLRRAGVETACWASSRVAGEREVAAEAARLIRPFAKHVATGLPFVTVKLAMTLDGRICDDTGTARWISSAASRRVTGALRADVDAVMVGAETVRQDDPSLLCHTKAHDGLWRAVVSKSGRLPKTAQIFTDAARERTRVYRSPGEAVRDLGARGFLHVLCEGGLGLARALAAEGLVDEWVTVLAPLVIGSRPLSEAVRLAGSDVLAAFGQTGSVDLGGQGCSRG